MSNKKNRPCSDCGIMVWPGTIKCKSCFLKSRQGPNYEENKLKKQNQPKRQPKKEYFCIDCNKKISRSATRCQSCSSKGELGSFYGKKHTEEVRDKIAKCRIGKWTGDKNPRVANPLNLEQNPNWKGGTSLDTIYSYKFKKKMRPLILKTYNCCQWCKTENDLVVHHIDHDIKNNDFCNLITLCRTCNIDEIHYQSQFKYYWFMAITQHKLLELAIGQTPFENTYVGAQLNKKDWCKVKDSWFPPYKPIIGISDEESGE